MNSMKKETKNTDLNTLLENIKTINKETEATKNEDIPQEVVIMEEILIHLQMLKEKVLPPSKQCCANVEPGSLFLDICNLNKGFISK